MSKGRQTIFAVSLVVLAAGCLLAATRLPLWKMRMEAPQYREDEALKVNVFAGAMTGDLQEITVLNQYIGVHIPESLPQANWLPEVMLAAAALGVIASLLPLSIRRPAVVLVALALAGSVAVALVQAKQQMWEIGHKRDTHTKLARVKDFTPPFLGTAKIAQFTVSSWLGTGAYLLGAAFLLQVGAAVVSRPVLETNSRKDRSAVVQGNATEVLA